MKKVIERRYGFGAAHVALRPASLRRRPTPSLREGLAQARREEGSIVRGELRRMLMAGAFPALLALLVSFVLAGVLTPKQDTAATEVVLLDPTPPPEVAVVEPEPEPIAEVAPEPEPVPEPAAEPEPEPEVVAVAPPPEPPPLVKAEPPRREPPPPPRKAPPRPAPALEPLAPPVVAKAEPLAPRPERARPAPAARPAPNLAFSAAPLPVETDPAPAQRAEPRFQAARPSDTRPRIGLAAPAAPLDDDLPEPTRDAPRSATRAPARSAPTRSAPPLDFAAAALPATPNESPRRDSAARRPVPAAGPPRRERGKPGSLALPASPGREPTPTTSAAAAPVRSARPSSPAPAPRKEEPGLRGVALASLDACVSDRQEDALKQRVVAAVQGRGRCESAAGRFDFVETKNVNAFLMRIEHAPGRRLGDRCAELLHALDCLARASRGGR